MADAETNLIIATSLETSRLPDEYRRPSTDVHHLVVDSLGIKDARWLIEKSGQSALEGDLQVFVIMASSLTVEAQNALLKLFEEPPKTTRFYLLLPHESVLLPTLRSRFIESKDDIEVDTSTAEDFLKMSYADRIKVIADKTKVKDSFWIESLVAGLAVKEKESGSKWSGKAKKALLLVDSYVRIRGASKKNLLEELSLSLPRA